MDQPEIIDGLRIARTRSRVSSFTFDKSKIAERIKQFYDRDTQDRKDDIDARLQRYAKFRMWRETGGPWEGATDSAIPDMMTASMRAQDTLHNAVMSQRPPIMPKAVKKVDAQKEEAVSHLIDYQVFVEQPGEDTLGQIIDDFVNEGFFTAYIPWIKEKRTTREVRMYPAIPQNVQPVAVFQELLLGKFPQAQLMPSKDGWDWKIRDGDKRHTASFFTTDEGELEMQVTYPATVYDGPRIIRKDLADVLHPARCENLQIKCASNPNGAAHVILRDYPTIDEINRLYNDGYYDLLDKDAADKLHLTKLDESDQEREQQKDILQGHTERTDIPAGAESHGTLTRLMCFDCFDVNGDGENEDVIFWMILETKTLLRACYLSEMFPANPPRRPFAEAQLFPVPGRRYGIGMLEMMEGVHDLKKQMFDQGADAGTFANHPFFFYRQTANIRPEVITLAAGEGYPLSDPKNDVNFPQMPNNSQAFTFNMLALLTQFEEKLTNIGELQLGRVPQGKSSALRTASGMQTVLAQGDARPERVLRRFFLGLAQIWGGIHSLNRYFLPKKKQYMITGFTAGQKDPYRQLDGPTAVGGDYLFEFGANALNTNKEALQGALDWMLGTYVSELAIQLGITDADGIYRLMRDAGRARGPDPDKYIKPPTPQALEPKIVFHEAIDMILSGVMPDAQPLEGAQAQLEMLTELVNDDERFGQIAPEAMPIFKAYMERIANLAMKERQQAALMQAAAQMAQQKPGALPGPQGAPAPADAQQMPQVGNNELVDESLPGAGGGANPGPGAV